jgi:2-polyprenyl-3-methyl-5-hydroxy-6-metoxy-1,4-benzoquinol methylase
MEDLFLECIVCKFNTYKVTPYVLKCPNCNFYVSSLKPGVGQDVEGISDLRKKNFKKIIKIIKTYQKKPDLLEIGSGDGYFIEECIKEKIRVTGSEASEEILDNLKLNFKVNLLKLVMPFKNNAELKKRYNVIIFNDVFEHLKNIHLVVKQLKTMITDDGIILINLPSSQGMIFRLSEFLYKFGINKFYDRLWQKGMSSPHLSYFNKSNLIRLFKIHNLHFIHAGHLDSVSFKNKERIKSSHKNKFLILLLSFGLSIFFLLQKLLPKDIIYLVFKK